MEGELASCPKEVVLYLNRNGVWDKIVSGLWNGCLVVAFACWAWRGVLFFCVVHLEDRRSLALWMFATVTHEQKSIRCKQESIFLGIMGNIW